MYAVEFQTGITNGIIEVPDAYRGQLSGSVRNIILADTSTEDTIFTTTRPPNLITRLFAHPRKVADVTPLKRDELQERR